MLSFIRAPHAVPSAVSRACTFAGSLAAAIVPPEVPSRLTAGSPAADRLQKRNRQPSAGGGGVPGALRGAGAGGETKVKQRRRPRGGSRGECAGGAQARRTGAGRPRSTGGELRMTIRRAASRVIFSSDLPADRILALTTRVSSWRR